MRATVIRNEWDYFRARAAGYDMVIEHEDLVTVTVTALVPRAESLLCWLDCYVTELFPEKKFTFSPSTKGEVIALLQEKIPGLQLHESNGKPPFSI